MIEMYALMAKGIMSEQDESVQQKYEYLRKEFTKYLTTPEENDNIAAMTAMIVALVDSGLLED